MSDQMGINESLLIVRPERKMVDNVHYEIVRKLKDTEIRRYPKLVIAKVEGSDEGFNILFRFISGENRQKTRISMTAPVVAERIEMTAPCCQVMVRSHLSCLRNMS
jgi:hypothetical protein